MEEQPVKRCGKCKVATPIEAFEPRAKGGRQGYCKPCLDAYKREYYQRNKAAYVARALKYGDHLKEVLRSAKDRPWVDCGMKYPPYVMDFDHRPGETKLFNVADLNARRWISVEALLAEIAKCDLVCANCHRERTHQRRKRVGRDTAC
jgi:hypothetical protein